MRTDYCPKASPAASKDWRGLGETLLNSIVEIHPHPGNSRDLQSPTLELALIWADTLSWQRVQLVVSFKNSLCSSHARAVSLHGLENRQKRQFQQGSTPRGHNAERCPPPEKASGLEPLVCHNAHVVAVVVRNRTGLSTWHQDSKEHLGDLHLSLSSVRQCGRSRVH